MEKKKYIRTTNWKPGQQQHGKEVGWD